MCKTGIVTPYTPKTAHTHIAILPPPKRARTRR